MATEKRLIDANALIKMLEKRTKTAYPNEFYGLMLAHDYIDDAPIVDAVEVVRCKDCRVTIQKWIPVTERLPEENDRYLCNVKSLAFPGCTYRAILHYDKRGGFREGNIYTDDVTHWMPLPEPPKKEDQ